MKYSLIGAAGRVPVLRHTRGGQGTIAVGQIRCGSR